MTLPHHVHPLKQLELDVHRVLDEAHPGLYTAVIALVSLVLVLLATVFLVGARLDQVALPVCLGGVFAIAVGVAVKAMGDTR